jgi:hypothetical protein
MLDPVDDEIHPLALDEGDDGSTPGKIENGPDTLTSAMLIRQSKSCPPDPPTATSWVTPPPFRQGTSESSANRTICT